MWTESDRAVWGGTGWRRGGQHCIFIGPPSQWNPEIQFSFLYNFHTNSLAHPTFYRIGAGSFSLKGKDGRIVKLPTHLHLLSRLMHGALLPHPIHLFNFVTIISLELSLLKPRNSYLKCRRPAEDEHYRKWKCQVSWPEHNAPWLSACLNCQICLKAFTVD
jgi:hypothetical protein